jgi:hypothetical protein
MVYCLTGFRLAGNILSILLILSKNLGESMRCVNDTCGNCLPTQNSEEPFLLLVQHVEKKFNTGFQRQIKKGPPDKTDNPLTLLWRPLGS